MWKDKVKLVGDYIIKHSKIAFPVIIIAAVAVTVTVALNAGGNGEAKNLTPESVPMESTEDILAAASQDVPLVENTDQAISTLIATFYNAWAGGDVDTIRSLCDVVADKDILHYQETAKYIEYYPSLEIYTKDGPEEGSDIAYVSYRVVFSGHEEEFPGYRAYYICTDEQGNRYIKMGENSEEVNEYITMVSAQDDVVEFNNRITVEFNELMMEKPELFEYLSEMDSQVSTAVGEQLAQQNATNTPEDGTAGNTENTDNTENTEGDAAGQEQSPDENTEQPAEQVPAVQYVVTTTTVNVRSSDSENADRLGKVPGGTQLQLQEQRVNGWSKIVYEGGDGYIKSEYLQIVESADGAETLGTVTATTNINVRASASETADRLGVLAGGDTAELLAREDGWCKIKYNGQVGYVKADYVQ